MTVLLPVQELAAAGVRITDIEDEAIQALLDLMTRTYGVGKEAFDIRDISPLHDLADDTRTSASNSGGADGTNCSVFDEDWTWSQDSSTTAGTINSPRSLQFKFPGVTQGTSPSLPQKYGLLFWGVCILSEAPLITAFVWQSGKNIKDVWDLNKLMAYNPPFGVTKNFVMYRPGEIVSLAVALPGQTTATDDNSDYKHRTIMRSFIAEPAGRTITSRPTQ